MGAGLDAGSHAVVARMETTAPVLHRAYMVHLLRTTSRAGQSPYSMPCQIVVSPCKIIPQVPIHNSKLRNGLLIKGSSSRER